MEQYVTRTGLKATIIHTLKIEGLVRPVVVCIKDIRFGNVRLERLTKDLKYMVSAQEPYIFKV